MDDSVEFSVCFEQLLILTGYSPDKLAELSGVPRATIINWRKGRVKKPRSWHDLVKVGASMRLREAEMSALLHSVGYPSVSDLLARTEDSQEQKLLEPWAGEVRQRIRQSPFQTIADLPYFVGREKELQALKDALLSGQHVMLYSLEGMGGSGKTVLAAHIAYLLRSHFPDGVLWAGLDTTDTMSILSVFANVSLIGLYCTQIVGNRMKGSVGNAAQSTDCRQ